MKTTNHLDILTPSGWKDYELLDSGNGQKLERFGPYTFARPEAQAIWKPALPQQAWDEAHGTFRGTDDAGSRWFFAKDVEPRWEMRYRGLKFWAQPTPFRHMGVFPEQASHWEWMTHLIQGAKRPANVLNLFAYTGLATLAASAAGAKVTHVDASKKVVQWASENHRLSGLGERPVRWIVDDVIKFVKREGRRGVRYDGFVIDPPKYGRGPEGELWQIETSLAGLLQDCRAIASDQPLFLILTCYAVQLSPVSLRNIVEQTMEEKGAQVTAGELANVERGTGRLLPAAMYVRWSA
jgi:23S rRNA (cytosine1962-C5)-methyltransferase